MVRRTPLHERHLAAGARLVDFAGFAMPLQYTTIRDEHAAVRTRAGLFDVSHMGEVVVSGPGALDAVQRLLTNDVARLPPGGCVYSMMCADDGGIVDDVVVMRSPEGSRLPADGFLVVVNASRRDADRAFMSEHLAAGARLDDVGDDTGLVALQGPAALAVAGRALSGGRPPAALRPFTAAPAGAAGVAELGELVVSRTGYTGEDGVEILCHADATPALWDRLLDAGADAGLAPAGLGARDTLRLEAGLRLYGQDMDLDVDPYSAGLGWTVKLGKGEFVGRAALAAVAAAGAPRRTVGLRLGGRAIARHGQEVLLDGRAVGTVTSGSFGFTVGAGIALARVERAAAAAARLEVDIRGRAAAAEVVPLPFYRRTDSPAPAGP